jgi:hypothetical protein
MLMLQGTLARVVIGLLSVAVGPATGRRRTPAADAAAALLEQLTAIDPSIIDDARRVSRSVVALAGLLETELGRFQGVEDRIDRAVGQLEATGAVEIGDELLTKLARRLGVLGVRPALERVERAHPDEAANGT